MFQEAASGAKSDRAGLRRALSALDAGDVLVVTRLDRLARSTLDLLHTLRQITERGAGVKSLADTWADTNTAHVPPPLAKKVDHLAVQLDRSRGWIVKQALAAWVDREHERSHADSDEVAP